MPSGKKIKGVAKGGKQGESVSGVWTSNQPRAILVSDIHLSEKPPIARSEEPDWFAAMLRPINQIAALATKYNCPIVCGGDVFDKFNPSPRLINFAIDHLPHMYSVCGQHDLRHHNYNDLEHTAYWVLVKAGKITHLRPEGRQDGWLMMYGFSWEQPVRPLDREKILGVTYLCVAHSYIWKDQDTSYPGAPPEKQIPKKILTKYFKPIATYDCCLHGDNHKSFLTRLNDVSVFNAGCLIRRKIDECLYNPRAGLLNADGTITAIELDCSQDKFIDVNDKEQYAGLVRSDEDMEQFMSELAKLGAASLDFHEAVQRFLRDSDNKVGKTAKRIILEAMGEEAKP